LHRLGGLAAIVLGGLLVLSGAFGVDVVAARGPSGPGMPEAPLPGYTPRFVTQTDEAPPWDDCLWASAAMLLDKWTHGRIQVDRQRLRRASGDFTAGSSFADLGRAVSRMYGWRPRSSPSGGDRMTWNDLLQRLADGGGAIVAGDYRRLGYPYIRWSLSYALNPRAAGHAMYIESYDAVRERLWLMDPLGRGSYRGEWVAASRIHSFVWKSGKFIQAVATPAPPASSAEGYTPGQLALDGGAHRAGETASLSLAFADQGPRPLPELQLATTWEVIAPDGWTVPVATPKKRARADRPVEPVRVPLAAPTTELTDDLQPIALPLFTAGTLNAELALPTEPGLWRLSMVIERRDGRALSPAWQQAPIEVRIWGDRGAVILPFAATADVSATGSLPITVMVENAGRLAWRSSLLDARLGEELTDIQAALRVSWIGSDGFESTAMAPLSLTAASGDQLALTLNLVAPRLPGTYGLRFDVHDGAGSLLAPDALGVDLPVRVAEVPVPTFAPVPNR
jgi:hypothetical protein